MKVWEDCGLGYENMERRRYHGEITEDKFLESTSHKENHRLLHQYDEQQIEDTINIEDWSNW